MVTVGAIVSDGGEGGEGGEATEIATVSEPVAPSLSVTVSVAV